MTLNLPLLYVLWLEEYFQISPNKIKSPNLWHVTSILVCCIFALRYYIERFWLQDILGFLAQACKWHPILLIHTIIMMKCSAIDFFSKFYMPLQSYCSPMLKIRSECLDKQARQKGGGLFWLLMQCEIFYQYENS